MAISAGSTIALSDFNTLVNCTVSSSYMSSTSITAFRAGNILSVNFSFICTHDTTYTLIDVGSIVVPYTIYGNFSSVIINASDQYNGGYTLTYDNNKIRLNIVPVKNDWYIGQIICIIAPLASTATRPTNGSIIAATDFAPINIENSCENQYQGSVGQYQVGNMIICNYQGLYQVTSGEGRIITTLKHTKSASWFQGIGLLRPSSSAPYLSYITIKPSQANIELGSIYHYSYYHYYGQIITFFGTNNSTALCCIKSGDSCKDETFDCSRGVYLVDSNITGGVYGQIWGNLLICSYALQTKVQRSTNAAIFNFGNVIKALAGSFGIGAVANSYNSKNTNIHLRMDANSDTVKLGNIPWRSQEWCIGYMQVPVYRP